MAGRYQCLVRSPNDWSTLLLCSVNRLTTPDGKPAADLEPHLGAMGHLIIVSEDRTRFVHAHPSSMDTGPAGTAKFRTRFPKPGLYKAWAEFQRNGKVITSDVVVRAPE